MASLFQSTAAKSRSRHAVIAFVSSTLNSISYQILINICMEKFLEDFPLQWHRIIRQHNNLLCALQEEYRLNRPGCPEDDFLNRIFYDLKLRIPLIMMGEDINREKLSEFVVGRDDDENRWIYFSCAYALASERAMLAGDLNLAWDFQCRAHLQYGLAASVDRSNKVFVQELMNMHLRSIAGDGGSGRAIRFDPYKNAAIEILRAGKIWKSLGQAEIYIIKEMEKKFPKKEDKNGNYIRPYASSSIKGWLRTLPEEDLDKLIPSYKAYRENGKATAKKKT